MSQSTHTPAIQGTVPVAAPPEAVYEHLRTVEGPAFAGRLTHETGRGAMLLIAPDAQGDTLLTIMIDTPADPRLAARLETVMRTELNRLENLVD
jgi:hypothetical protein